jgi:hypothetical protein
MAEKLTVGGLAGCYANHLKVGQNAFEFLLDFGQFYRADGDEKFYVRIITAPVYAKAFLNVLRECIDHYEQTFGNIPEAQDQLLVGTQKPDKGWIV